MDAYKLPTKLAAFGDSRCAVRLGEDDRDGATWQKATIDPPVQRSWQKFSLHWRPESIGKAVLTSRAIGKNELVQPLINARNAAYTVRVTVTSKS